MRKVILILMVFGLFQSAVAQQKKKSATTTSKTTAAKKPTAVTKAATSKTATGADTKEVAPQKATTTKPTISNNKQNSQKTTSSRTSVAEAYNEGDLQLNAGVGASSWGIPVYVGADYFVTDDISVGAEISYQTRTEKFFAQQNKSTIIGIGANGNYHFNRILETSKEWDLYAGLGLNYFIWTFDNSDYKGANASGIALGGQLGARYFFNNKFAINVELGGASATSGARIGITYKFK